MIEWWSNEFEWWICSRQCHPSPIQPVSHMSCCKNSSGKCDAICLTALNWHHATITSQTRPRRWVFRYRWWNTRSSLRVVKTNWTKLLCMWNWENCHMAWKLFRKTGDCIEKYVIVPTFLFKEKLFWMCVSFVQGDVTYFLIYSCTTFS